MSLGVLPAKKALALSLLLSGQTAEQAAQAAGVTPRTLRRWKTEPDFQAALDQAANEMTKDAARALSALMREGIDELGKLLRDPKLSSTDKLRVINTILARWPAVNDAAIVSDQIKRLEELIK